MRRSLRSVLQDIYHAVDNTGSPGVDPGLQVSDGVQGARGIYVTAVDIVAELKVNGLIGRCQGVGMPAVAGQKILRDSPAGCLGVGVSFFDDLIFAKTQPHLVKISNHGLGRPAGVRLSFLVAFFNFERISFEQTWKIFGGIFHHGLKSDNLLRHIRRNHS